VPKLFSISSLQNVTLTKLVDNRKVVGKCVNKKLLAVKTTKLE
jgi:hypothetical protein